MRYKNELHKLARACQSAINVKLRDLGGVPDHGLADYVRLLCCQEQDLLQRASKVSRTLVRRTQSSHPSIGTTLPIEPLLDELMQTHSISDPSIRRMAERVALKTLENAVRTQECIDALGADMRRIERTIAHYDAFYFHLLLQDILSPSSTQDLAAISRGLEVAFHTLLHNTVLPLLLKAITALHEIRNAQRIALEKADAVVAETVARVKALDLWNTAVAMALADPNTAVSEKSPATP